LSLTLGNMFYTYAHYKKDTGELFYIGKGKGIRHTVSNNRNNFWNNIVNKHGFFSKILATWKTESEAFEHEKVLIYSFKKMNYTLANMTDGGEGSTGWVPDDNWKLKRSKIAKEQYVSGVSKINTPDAIKKSVEKRKGKSHSVEHRKKISLSLLNNTRTLGNKLTAEHKERIKLSLIGNTRMVGKKLSDETKQKIAASTSLAMKQSWAKRKQIVKEPA